MAPAGALGQPSLTPDPHTASIRIPLADGDGYTARMKPRHLLPFIILSLFALALAGCGNKGPLVLPDKTQGTTVDGNAAEGAPTGTPPSGETPAR